MTDSIDTVGRRSYPLSPGSGVRETRYRGDDRPADPQVPDPAARPWLAQALTEFSEAAANCQAGASSHNTALSNQAAAEVRLATADIEQLNTAIGAHLAKPAGHSTQPEPGVMRWQAPRGAATPRPWAVYEM